MLYIFEIFLIPTIIKKLTEYSVVSCYFLFLQSRKKVDRGRSLGFGYSLRGLGRTVTISGSL